MSFHGGAPIPMDAPRYRPCPHCGKKGFYEYTVPTNGGRWHIERCKYCKVETQREEGPA
jgi:hypothetical protein